MTTSERPARVGDRVKRIHRPENCNPIVTARCRVSTACCTR